MIANKRPDTKEDDLQQAVVEVFSQLSNGMPAEIILGACLTLVAGLIDQQDDEIKHAIIADIDQFINMEHDKITEHERSTKH